MVDEKPAADKPAKQEAKAEEPPARAAPAQEASTQPPAFSSWIFVALFVALCVSASSQADLSSPADVTAYWKKLTGPHVVKPPRASKDEVVIQFCQSCGTNGLYNQISDLIQTSASRSLSVRPESYPPHPAAALAAQVISMAQMGAIMSLFLFDSALPAALRENKMATCFSLWMVGSMFSGSLTKTSAFEIYLGKKLVWSTLKHGRHPNLQDLVDGFASAGVTIRTGRH